MEPAEKDWNYLEGILIEKPDLAYENTIVTQEFTKNILQKMGLSWHMIPEGYLEKYFRALDEFGAFEEGYYE